MTDVMTTRHIISAQALSLVYEARMWPHTRGTALRYMEIGQAWADRHGARDLYLELAERIREMEEQK